MPYSNPTFYSAASSPLDFFLSIDMVLNPNAEDLYVVVANLTPPGGFLASSQIKNTFAVCCSHLLDSPIWCQKYHPNTSLFTSNIQLSNELENAFLLFEVKSLKINP